MTIQEKNQLANTVTSIKASCYDADNQLEVPKGLGKKRSLSFSADKDGIYRIDNFEFPVDDHVAVLALALLMIEQHWERQYQQTLRHERNAADRQAIDEAHAWDVARVERARAWLNQHFADR